MYAASVGFVAGYRYTCIRCCYRIGEIENEVRCVKIRIRCATLCIWIYSAVLIFLSIESTTVCVCSMYVCVCVASTLSNYENQECTDLMTQRVKKVGKLEDFNSPRIYIKSNPYISCIYMYKIFSLFAIYHQERKERQRRFSGSFYSWK